MDLYCIMTWSQIGILIAIVLLMVFSMLFSLCEISYSAASKVRLKTLENSGKKRAKRALKQLERYDKVITTILIGNTIVTVASASLATLLFVGLFVSEALAGLVSSIAVTGFLLIFCEISPKMLAKERPEGIAMAMQPFISFLMIIFWPFTAFFSLWKKLLRKIFRIKNQPAITEEELLTYVDEAKQEGGIEAHEQTLIRSAIEFEDVDVVDVMVPRVEVIAVSKTTSHKKIEAVFREHAFSRMPVFGETIDNIVGILHERDFREVQEGSKKLNEVLREAIFVVENAKISTTLRTLQKKKSQMAIVVDEFGGTSGIVTMEDILEELVGEIYDEHDEEEILITKEGDGSFTVAGIEHLDDLFETLNFTTQEEFDSTSVGGFVAEIAGKIPDVGETIRYENLEITVLAADEKKVIQVSVVKREDELTDSST